MTATQITADLAPGGSATVARPPTGWAVHDTLAIARRNLVSLSRQPQLIVFSTIQPVIFVLLFTYVFGGAIAIPGVDYVDYLMPGIFCQTVVFGAINTTSVIVGILVGGIFGFYLGAIWAGAYKLPVNQDTIDTLAVDPHEDAPVRVEVRARDAEQADEAASVLRDKRATDVERRG